MDKRDTAYAGLSMAFHMACTLCHATIAVTKSPRTAHRGPLSFASLCKPRPTLRAPQTGARQRGFQCPTFRIRRGPWRRGMGLVFGGVQRSAYPRWRCSRAATTGARGRMGRLWRLNDLVRLLAGAGVVIHFPRGKDAISWIRGRMGRASRVWDQFFLMLAVLGWYPQPKHRSPMRAPETMTTPATSSP
jgi:hypothetical protein